MVVDLYQVLNPHLTKCWDSEVTLLTSQEGIDEAVVDRPYMNEFT